MSMTLNLTDRLLAMGRKFQDLGRDYDARQVLGKLADFQELPAAVAEETQVRLAELHLKHRRFRRARRHLTAALAHQPDQARYHYLLANALNNDDRADPRRAAVHYRRSLELDAEQPRCLGEFGLLALTLNETEEGLTALRRAVELAPDDPEVVGNLVEGLRQEGLLDEARMTLRRARFRNPRDVRFTKLRNDFEFAQLRQDQENERHGGQVGDQPANGPVLLPFAPLPPGTTPSPAGGKTVRRDAATSPPPHLPHHDRQHNRRRAQ